MSSSSIARSSAFFPSIFSWALICSTICWLMVKTGFKLESGSWKIIAIEPPRSLRIAFSGAPINSSPRNLTLPAVILAVFLGKSPSIARALTLFPEPDSPTSAID